ncbi:MAG TPA: PadR family transcriptional regulator [Solirubrobacteraceae bacterium]
MTHEATAGRFDPRWLGWLAMAGRHHHGRHRHGGRDFRFGGPMGFGGGPGGPWGGRGPRARRGDVRAALLTLLAEEPRNGYQLMQEIERRSEGVWRPSPGSVYPALQQLEDEGLIRSDESEGRKQFHLTDAGREAAAAAGDEGAPWDAVSDAVDSDVWELFGVARQVGMAIFQLAQAGTPAQIAQAREVLTNARRALYGILAEDEKDA